MELKQIIEALLFAADRALSPKDLRAILASAADEDTPGATAAFRNTKEAQIGVALEELKIEYDTQMRSYQLIEQATGWRLVSRPEFAPWVKKLLDEARPYRLSQPALETLSIIALRQPISRADVAAIRGVEVDGVMKSLLERGLINIVGRSDAPGKPMLYGTTDKFLEHFGLRSVDDMPKAEELRQQAAALKTGGAPAEDVTPTPPSSESPQPDQPAPSDAKTVVAAAPENAAPETMPVPTESERESDHEGTTREPAQQD